MPPTLEQLGIDRLSNQDRLKLIGDIWDSITFANEADVPEVHHNFEQVCKLLASRPAGCGT